MRDVIIFLMCFLLAKKDIELVGQVHKLSMELSSRVENQSLAALVKICEKVLHITGFRAIFKFMTFVYTFRWLIGIVVS